MEKIFFITGNAHKLNEAKSILEPLGFEVIGEKLELIEPNDMNQEEIVIYKAKQAYEILKKPLIVDDSGIYFKDFNDFPGIYTKKIIKTLGYLGIKSLLQNKSKEAFFKTMLCYIDKNGHKTYSGISEGKISLDRNEELDKSLPNPFSFLFIPKNFDKTMSELPEGELKKVSHRAKAFMSLYQDLNNSKIKI